MRRFALGLVASVLLTGCGRTPAARPATSQPNVETRSLPRALPLELLADRAPDASLPPARMPGEPAARLVLLRVSPGREHEAPPPDASPAEPPAPTGTIERLPSDEQLRPPVPRDATSLRLAGARGRWLELDVRVDETGAVSAAELAAGNADSALVRAAIAAAKATRWYPAQLAGRPVAVWSRQRLEVGR